MVQSLRVVEGDLVIQNNPNLHSLEGLSQSLEDIHGQVSETTSNPRYEILSAAESW